YFKGKTLLENQFTTLVEPNASEALIIDIRQNESEVVADIIRKLSNLNNQ
ncbi:MAG: gluconokinase, partial [Psychromonas sp.]